MTDILQPAKSSSRRALLAGALGGLGAWAATAIGRASPVRAGIDGDVVLGDTNTATTVTKITNTSGGNALWGDVPSGTGILGSSANGAGVGAIGGSSTRGALEGRSNGNATGVFGFSGSGNGPAVRAKTGVYGYAAQDSSALGVTGETTAGHGVHGIATTGYAGYFAGKVYTTKWYEMTEVTVPAAPSANRARLFVKVNGSGLTQLCVRFNTGTIKVLATQS